MKAYGNGFTVVAARHSCPLPVRSWPTRRPTAPQECAPAPAADLLPAPERGDVQAFAGKVSAAVETAPADAAGAGPVGTLPCAGCGLPVSADYTARTGSDRHGPCQPTPATKPDPEPESVVRLAPAPEHVDPATPRPVSVEDLAEQLAALSAWIDTAPANQARDGEARLWGRVAKVGEEAGEAIAALIGATGQNPRKGTTHQLGDVRAELLDVAVTALAAVEHLDGNHATSLTALSGHLARVTARAGLSGGGAACAS